MSFLKAIFDDADALESLGTEVRTRARSRGMASVFSDPEHEGLILIEHPDGSVVPYAKSDDRRHAEPADQQRKFAKR